MAVVAFSRAAVLSLAGIARKAGARASVIFGKLPPEARRKQLDDALAGRLDVLVGARVGIKTSTAASMAWTLDAIEQT